MDQTSLVLVIVITILLVWWFSSKCEGPTSDFSYGGGPIIIPDPWPEDPEESYGEGPIIIPDPW